ncbi:unnamed protein product, partial [Schistocephalus solidus]|uniref:Metalloendopeptidase n=1 Tax=Schistocephalus solidus TaxID=70667 RepID=A0A183SL75_SCHSO
GRQYYRTEISIGSDCASVGIILHEIGHAIGFWHEHTRPDRDAFVKIHWDQIDGQYRRNFNLKNSGEIDSLGEPYDYDSIMHYGRNSFAKSKDSETITPKAGMAAIGQRKGLSPGDIRQTNKLYRCDCKCTSARFCCFFLLNILSLFNWQALDGASHKICYCIHIGSFCAFPFHSIARTPNCSLKASIKC